MQLIDNLSQANLHQDTVLTIGSFDGVHWGHQHLISQILRRAREKNFLAGLITFYPHPAAVLTPDKAPRNLTSPGEKVALLKKLGLDLVAILPFDLQVVQTSARDFIMAIKQHLRLKELWIGPGFALGRKREGDLPILRALGQELGFSVTSVEPLLWKNEIVSSTRIRHHLAAGRVCHVTTLLRRYPSLSGEVVPGSKRKRQQNIPTVNLTVRPDRAIPADGVYAVYAVLGQERHLGVASIGVRPGFDNGERTIEIHILDFKENIYGIDLVVEFVERLRNKQWFSNVDELMTQIAQDIEQTRLILTGTPLPLQENGEYPLTLERRTTCAS